MAKYAGERTGVVKSKLMESLVRIGTCGFSSTKEAYRERLSTVEIQHTFYQPPMITTLERWRKEMPPEFEFTLKAWQLITHTSKSPTFKRLRRRLTETEFNEAGSFRPTAIVKEAWEITLACATALQARTVLFQCPASFIPSKDHIRDLESFFTSVERGGLNFCWEPRGDWDDSLIRSLCERLDLWHVVDPFSRATVTPDRCYFRLHGRIRWRYEYEDGELEELVTMLPKDRLGYVFFNNITMRQDAERFQRMVKESETY